MQLSHATKRTAKAVHKSPGKANPRSGNFRVARADGRFRMPAARAYNVDMRRLLPFWRSWYWWLLCSFTHSAAVVTAQSGAMVDFRWVAVLVAVAGGRGFSGSSVGLVLLARLVRSVHDSPPGILITFAESHSATDSEIIATDTAVDGVTDIRTTAYGYPWYGGEFDPSGGGIPVRRTTRTSNTRPAWRTR